jgi:hypothetical protein
MCVAFRCARPSVPAPPPQLVAGLPVPQSALAATPMAELPQLLHEYTHAKVAGQPRHVRRLYRSLIDFAPSRVETVTALDLAPAPATVVDDADGVPMNDGTVPWSVPFTHLLRRGHFGVATRSSAVRCLSKEWARRQTQDRPRARVAAVGAARAATDAVVGAGSGVVAGAVAARVWTPAVVGAGRPSVAVAAPALPAATAAAASGSGGRSGSSSSGSSSSPFALPGTSVSGGAAGSSGGAPRGQSAHAAASSVERGAVQLPVSAPAAVRPTAPPPLAKRRSVFKWGRQFEFLK